MAYRILVAEDDGDIVQVLKLYLNNVGHEVLHAPNGAEALKIMEQQPVDLGIFDIMMPRMDGYTATREIRTLPNNRKAIVPIVAMTANAFEEDRKKAFECGMNGHIVKPIDRKSISKVLDQIFKEAK